MVGPHWQAPRSAPSSAFRARAARRPRLGLLLALVALALATGCASTPPPVPGAPVLDDLNIHGTQAVSHELLRARIITAGSPWLPFAEKRYYDEIAFETDLERILRLYRARGYYKARIERRTVTPSGGGEVDVDIWIDEGPPTRISALQVEGLEQVPAETRRHVLDGLPLREGVVFTEDDYDAFKSRLADRLRDHGYAEAEVGGNVRVVVPEDRAEVVIRATTGQRLRFGRVFVAGSNQVPRRKISAEARVAVPEGGLYSESLLERAQERVFDLGVFSAVKVTRGAPDRAAGNVPVVVNVREAPFRTLRLAVGFGIDRNRQELPRASAEWVNRNFFGGLRRLTFANEAALVFIPTVWNYREKLGVGVAGTSRLELRQPDIWRNDLDLLTSLEYERGLEPAYLFNSGSARIGLVYTPHRSVTIVPSYNFSLFALQPQSGVEQVRPANQEAALDECAQRGDLCRLAYLEQRLTWDRRDSPVETRRGTFVSLSLQEGSRGLGGAYDYFALLPEVRGYHPFRGRHVIAARVQAGLLVPTRGGTSSVLTRYYLGGATSHRGFGSRELSPRFAVPNDDPNNPQAEALPVGGNGMLNGSFEIRWGLPANFGFVTFVDAGEVAPSIEELSLDAVHVALGVGLRYRTIFGPIRFDLGYRINNLSPASSPPGIPITRSPDLPPGATLPEVGRIAFHFSIGEAF